MPFHATCLARTSICRETSQSLSGSVYGATLIDPQVSLVGCEWNGNDKKRVADEPLILDSNQCIGI
jgi:hypothetical protein